MLGWANLWLLDLSKMLRMGWCGLSWGCMVLIATILEGFCGGTGRVDELMGYALVHWG
jgi:hypothetical protein